MKNLWQILCYAFSMAISFSLLPSLSLSSLSLPFQFGLCFVRQTLTLSKADLKYTNLAFASRVLGWRQAPPCFDMHCILVFNTNLCPNTITIPIENWHTELHISNVFIETVWKARPQCI